MKLRCSNHDCDSSYFTARAIEYVTITVDDNGDWQDTMDVYDSSKDLDEAECGDCGRLAEWYDPKEKKKLPPITMGEFAK